MTQRWLPLHVTFAGLAGLAAASCGSSVDQRPATVGDFIVQAGPTGLSVVSASNRSRKILESVTSGVGAYAPAAVRTGHANFEMMFGSFRITDDNTPWRSSQTLRVERRPADGLEAAWRDQNGGLLVTLSASAPAPGTLRLDLRAASADVNRLSLAFACTADERFAGFGAQADGIDHRGQKVPIWTSEPGIGKTQSDDPQGALWFVEGTRHASSMGLPVWMSSRGYLGVAATNKRSIFELCSVRTDAWRLEAWDNQVTLWIYDGPAPATALERATAGVLGRPKRPPALVFAPWGDAIFGSANVRLIASLYRENKIPCSIIWTEDWRGGEDWIQGYRVKEEWIIDRTMYPDAEALAAELRAAGFAWLAYFNTFMIEGSTIYTAGLDGGHFVRKQDGTPYLFNSMAFRSTGLIDITRPATREWVKSYMRGVLDAGFVGWMFDFGEWLPADAVLASGADPLEYHNLYALDWNKLNAEVLAEREADGVQRLFFARSGWMGSAPVVPAWWSGDQWTTFQKDDGLPSVIPIGLNLGIVGISHYGHDIAGYQNAATISSTKELFFRWTTLGALSPIMRTHHGTRARVNWWFGKDAETMAHFKRWSRLHQQLFPYLDGASRVSETTGLPIMRALLLEFPDDPLAWTIADQFLLGPALLVAPVVDEGAVSRRVHFPSGRWFPLEGGAPVDGPVDLEVALPVTEIGVYGRAGRIVPMHPEGVETVLPASAPTVSMESVLGQRTLLVFTGAQGQFTERDGTTYAVQGALASGAAELREAGALLSACASSTQRGCVAGRDEAKRRIAVRLSGTGPLESGSFQLTATGTARTLDVILAW
jgi:alpha-glucosidase